jgi:hypothetical protein
VLLDKALAPMGSDVTSFDPKMKASLTLGDLDGSGRLLEIRCSRCDRYGRERIDRLIERYSRDARLPDLRHELARDCPRRNASVYEQCDVLFRSWRRVVPRYKTGGNSTMRIEQLTTDVVNLPTNGKVGEGLKGLMIGIAYSLKKADELRFVSRPADRLGPDYIDGTLRRYPGIRCRRDDPTARNVSTWRAKRLLRTPTRIRRHSRDGVFSNLSALNTISGVITLPMAHTRRHSRTS